MPKRKKNRPKASKTAKGRKSVAAGRKTTGPRGPDRAAASGGGKPNDGKPNVQRLRRELARALAEIEHLKASSETDFLLEILNRRGFERELTRSIAFIKRYGASGALLVLDVYRLKPINDALGHA